MINEKEFKKLCNSYAIADSNYHEAIFDLEILQETVDNLKWIIEDCRSTRYYEAMFNLKILQETVVNLKWIIDDYRLTREHIHEQILEAMTGQ